MAELPPLIGPLVHRALLVPQPGVTELVLVRHGQAERLPDGTRKEELFDPPLSERGHRQAAAVAAALAAAPVAAVYASPLRRAADTAAAIAEKHGHAPMVRPELREYEAFRDVPEGESVRSFVPPEQLERMAKEFVSERRWDSFPFSEPGDTFRTRVAGAIDAIADAHPAERVVIACHGGVINAYIAHLWNTSEDMLFNPAHASISRVMAREGRRAIATLNELAHLEDLVDY